MLGCFVWVACLVAAARASAHGDGLAPLAPLSFDDHSRPRLIALNTGFARATDGGYALVCNEHWGGLPPRHVLSSGDGEFVGVWEDWTVHRSVDGGCTFGALRPSSGESPLFRGGEMFRGQLFIADAGADAVALWRLDRLANVLEPAAEDLRNADGELWHKTDVSHWEFGGAEGLLLVGAAPQPSVHSAVVSGPADAAMDWVELPAPALADKQVVVRFVVEAITSTGAVWMRSREVLRTRLWRAALGEGLQDGSTAAVWQAGEHAYDQVLGPAQLQGSVWWLVDGTLVSAPHDHGPNALVSHGAVDWTCLVQHEGQGFACVGDTLHALELMEGAPPTLGEPVLSLRDVEMPSAMCLGARADACLADWLHYAEETGLDEASPGEGVVDDGGQEAIRAPRVSNSACQLRSGASSTPHGWLLLGLLLTAARTGSNKRRGPSARRGRRPSDIGPSR